MNKTIFNMFGILVLLLSTYIIIIDPSILGNMVGGFFMMASIIFFVIADAQRGK